MMQISDIMIDILKITPAAYCSYLIFKKIKNPKKEKKKKNDVGQNLCSHDDCQDFDRLIDRLEKGLEIIETRYNNKYRIDTSLNDEEVSHFTEKAKEFIGKVKSLENINYKSNVHRSIFRIKEFLERSLISKEAVFEILLECDFNLPFGKIIKKWEAEVIDKYWWPPLTSSSYKPTDDILTHITSELWLRLYSLIRNILMSKITHKLLGIKLVYKKEVLETPITSELFIKVLKDKIESTKEELYEVKNVLQKKKVVEKVINIFYLCSSEDLEILNKIENHLSTLKHKNKIKTWHKSQLEAGSDCRANASNCNATIVIRL
jgi:hypothetical protein